MTDFLCRLTIKKLIDNQIIEEEDIEVYEYGLTLLIGTLLKIIGLIIIGLLTGLLKEIIVFLIFFSGLRIHAGGYHAKSILNCFLGTLILIGIAVFFVKIFPTSYQPLFNLISLIVSLLLVFLLSPVESENRPLTKEERIHYRKRSLSTAIIGTIFILYLTFIRDKFLYFASIASMGFLIESITLLNFRKLKKN